jgi:hypothetical protein
MEQQRRLCAGDVETPFFVEKFLSKDNIKVIGDLARALVAKPSWRIKKSSGRDSVTGKHYLSECFNNVDQE